MENEMRQFREKIRGLVRKLGLLSKSSNEFFCCREVTLPQCHALVEIGRTRGLSLKDLATVLSLDASTTSRTVENLVRKGYVERKGSVSDRRRIIITLTETGETLFSDIERKMDFSFSELFENIPEEEKAGVLHSLDVLLAAFSLTSSS